MSQFKSIADAWESYNRDVLHREAPPVQRSECRLAFWAGAAQMFGLMNKAAAMDMSDGCYAIDALHEELEEFLRERERANAARRGGG